jgi:predicted dehydrogenase
MANKINRRDILKGLASLPFLGALGWAAKRDYNIYNAPKQEKEAFINSLKIDVRLPEELQGSGPETLRIGIVGIGIRGTQLLQALGFMHPDIIKDWEQNQPQRLQAFLEQEDMNVKITGVCDLFEYRVEQAVEIAGREGHQPTVFKTFHELCESSEVDAVVIAATDLWHVPIALAALKAGKHVYVEKPMTHKLSEVFELRKAVQESGKVLQLGHHQRQNQSYITAMDIVEKGILGHINLVETSTNRNDDNGAWQYNMYEEFPETTIDWEQYIKGYYNIPFSREMFFRWRKYWKFGSGLTGDLLSHSYDSINCILKMGIPKYAVASGGIYTHRDGRVVPDVLQATMEFPDYLREFSQKRGKEKGMTLLYTASLGNQFNRKTKFMGHDGTMELGSDIYIYPDARSTSYNEYLQNNTISPDEPIFYFDPASQTGIDAITSATTKYFADKGLLLDYRNGRAVDVTHLHMKEWINSIRTGRKPSCSIDEGFQEAISCIMATLATKTGRRVEWDHENEEMAIEGMRNPDFDRLLIAD